MVTILDYFQTGCVLILRFLLSGGFQKVWHIIAQISSVCVSVWITFFLFFRLVDLRITRFQRAVLSKDFLFSFPLCPVRSLGTPMHEEFILLSKDASSPFQTIFFFYYYYIQSCQFQKLHSSELVFMIIVSSTFRWNVLGILWVKLTKQKN